MIKQLNIGIGKYVCDYMDSLRTPVWVHPCAKASTDECSLRMPSKNDIVDYASRIASAIRNLLTRCKTALMPVKKDKSYIPVIKDFDESRLWFGHFLRRMYKESISAGQAITEDEIERMMKNFWWVAWGYSRFLDALIVELHIDKDRAMLWTCRAVVDGYDHAESYPEILKEIGAPCTSSASK